MPGARSSDRFDSLRAVLGPPFDAVRFIRAPGRVNLIGDHTDYQDGLCLPIAIDRDVLIGFRPRTDGEVRVRSLDLDLDAAFDLTEPLDLTNGSAWERAVAWTIAQLGERSSPLQQGFDAAIASTVPIGAGLSSSAAFMVALALVAAAANERAFDRIDIARTAQTVERRVTGVPCGVMDQMASLSGRAGQALLLDCRTLTTDLVPIPPDVRVLVVHSGLARQLAGSAYAERRAACEAAAARLGIPTLRDATLEQVADDPIARHVVTENARVEAFAGALRAGDTTAAGALMLASHRSLRDDFAVSTPELDLLVDFAVDAGAYGARLTGAGFGGCVVALVGTREVDAVAGAMTDRYRAATGREPNAFAVAAVDGAGFVDPPDAR